MYASLIPGENLLAAKRRWAKPNASNKAKQSFITGSAGKLVFIKVFDGRDKILAGVTHI